MERAKGINSEYTNNLQKIKHLLHFDILDLSRGGAEGAGGESEAFEVLSARMTLVNRCST